MFVFPQISYVKILTPKRMVLGGGAFGRCLGHEGRAFRNGIHVIKETHHRSLDPCIPRAHSEILAVCNLERYWRSAIWSDTGGLQSGTILAVCNLERYWRSAIWNDTGGLQSGRGPSPNRAGTTLRHCEKQISAACKLPSL